MDETISGLNKVKVTGSNGNKATISNGVNTWEKTITNGAATFLIPSIPAPGKRNYSLVVKTTSGTIVYSKTIPMGFGDDLLVKTGNDSVIESGDNISVSSPISKSKNAYGTISLSHATSGVSSGSYGSSSTSVSHGGQITIPKISVNSTGHVTSASSSTITFPSFIIKRKTFDFEFDSKTYNNGDTVYSALYEKLDSELSNSGKSNFKILGIHSKKTSDGRFVFKKIACDEVSYDGSLNAMGVSVEITYLNSGYSIHTKLEASVGVTYILY